MRVAPQELLGGRTAESGLRHADAERRRQGTARSRSGSTRHPCVFWRRCPLTPAPLRPRVPARIVGATCLPPPAPTPSAARR